MSVSKYVQMAIMFSIIPDFYEWHVQDVDRVTEDEKNILQAPYSPRSRYLRKWPSYPGFHAHSEEQNNAHHAGQSLENIRISVTTGKMESITQQALNVSVPVHV